MTSKAKKLLNEALQLPPAEREALAGQLFEDLEVDDPDAEPVWQAEIEQRITELDRGQVKPIPWDEARPMIFGDRWPWRSAKERSMQTTHAATAEAAILSRLVKANRADFSPEVAEALLRLDFDQADRDRLHELAVKGQEGSLTKAEEEELDSYRRIGYFVDLMRSKARLSLKNHGR